MKAASASIAEVTVPQEVTRSRTAWGPGVLALPAVLLIIPIFIIPVGMLLLTSFGTDGWSLLNYRRVLFDPVLWSVLWRTIELAVEVTALCAVIGYPVAYLILRASPGWQKIAMLLITLPVWTSVLVRAYAWMVILGRTGVVNQLLMSLGITGSPTQLLYTRFAVLVGLVHVLLPYAIFPMLSVMQRIDTRLVGAAECLGARPWVAFLLVFLPLSLPGVGSACIIVFLLSIGYFVTPALLGGLKETTYVMLIQKQIESLTNWGLASAMCVVLLLITLLIVVVFGRSAGMFGGDGAGLAKPPRILRLVSGLLTVFATWRAGSPAGRPRREAAMQSLKRRRRTSLGVHIFGWTVIAFIVLPIIIFFPLSLSGSSYLEFPPHSYSFRWFVNYFTRRDWVDSTITSFEVAILSSVSATVIGAAAAIGLSRAKFRFSELLLPLLISPAVVPTLITAVAIYFQFARMRLIGSVVGLALAHLVLALPFVILVVLGALRRVDIMPERAARSLGAHPVRAFVKTTLVAIRPSVLSALLFAFLVSFDDVVVALFISGTSATTLPKRMWDGIRLEIDPTIAAASTLLILLSLVCMLLVEVVNSRAKKRST